MSTAEEAEAVWRAAQREVYGNDSDEDEELLRGVPCADDVVPMYGDPAMQVQPRLEDAVKGNGVVRVDSGAGPSLQAATAEVATGVCEYPPLSLVSFMMRGDNGVVRWLTASGLRAERASRKRGREDSKEKAEAEEEEEVRLDAVRELRRRHGGSGLGYVNVPALLQRLYDEAANVAEDRMVPPPPSPGGQRRGGDEEALWVMKYSPRQFRELLSDDNVNLKLLQWLKSWDAYIFHDTSATRHGGNAGTTTAAGETSAPTRPEERLAVLVGPPGVGKTTLAHVLAAHCGYETVEINASVDRTASAMERAIQLAVSPARGRRRAPPPSSTTSSSNVDGTSKAASKTVGTCVSLADMLLRPKCLIIDEMDGIAANVASFLLQQDIHCPVFCLCNDFYVPSLRSLRRQCQHVYHFPPIRPQRLLSRLTEIAELEGLSVSQPALADLVRSSNGDVRCCLNTLQFMYRYASPAGGGKDPLQLMREMQGKDSKLGLWDTWRAVFERQERGKYIHLLRKEYAMDYGATVMAGSQHNLAATTTTGRDGGPSHSTGDAVQPHEEEEHVALGFRVDPGYVYVSLVAQQCADTNALLDGLQEFYVQRSYADYSFKQTQRMADAFSFQDNLATCSYRDAASAALIPFVEQYASTTAAACFSCCSSSRRAGVNIGFPRESAGLSRRMAESVNIARTFREGCRAETAAHMCLIDVISQEIAPLLLRSLLDVSLRVPAHSLASLSSLSPQDQQLLLASVARHAEYGMTYARFQTGGNETDGADGTVQEHWELTPPIHRLGCVSLEAAGPTPPTRRATLAAPSLRTSASASWRPAAPIMVLQMTEELRQLMVGEIRRFVIQRNAANTARSAAHAKQPPQAVRQAGTALAAGGLRGREEEEGAGGTAPVSKAVKTSHAAPPAVPDVASIPNPRPAAGRRDFFGRPIPEAAAKASSSTACKTPTAAAASARVTVQYIYHDGSTNAVRIPAAFADF